jgi:hypothetical protein
LVDRIAIDYWETSGLDEATLALVRFCREVHA